MYECVRDCEALKTVWDCFQELSKRQYKNPGPKALTVLQEEELDGVLRERLLQRAMCRGQNLYFTIALYYRNAYGCTHTHLTLWIGQRQ